MSEHFIITLRVFDRSYRLRIRRKDERKYRDAAVAIERKTNQYRRHFAESETESLQERDYLTMTTIQALSEKEELEADNRLFEDRIKSMIDELDEYLKNSK